MSVAVESSSRLRDEEDELLRLADRLVADVAFVVAARDGVGFEVAGAGLAGVERGDVTISLFTIGASGSTGL